MTPAAVADGATGPRPWLAPVLAVSAGLALLLAQPPAGLWLAAFVAPGLLMAAITRPAARPAMLGFVTGLVLYLPLLAWLRFRATVVAWILLALVMAGWMALLAWGLARLARSAWGLAVAPMWWVGVDAWRNSVPWDGFGWATIGISQVDNSWMAPLARVLGEKGLTLAVVAIGLAAWAAVAAAIDPWAFGPGRDDSTLRVRGADPEARQRAAFLPTLVLAGLVLGVALVTVGPPVTIGMIDALAVQPNDLEDDPRDYTAITRQLANQALALTASSLDEQGPADLVVWPEGSVGRDPARDPQLAAVVAEAGRLTGGRAVIGTDIEDDGSENYRRVSVLVDAEGRIEQTYVKQRLVPFGEYVPLRPLFDWYPALDQVSRDAISGSEPSALELAALDGRPLTLALAICFETLHPDTVRANVLAGDTPAQLLVTSTSSSSFGRSAQSIQHLEQTRMRALETGRWVVHATSSGTTAIVDNNGVVRERVEGLFTQGVVRGEVGLATGLTPFLRWGDVLAPTSQATSLLVGLWLVAARRRSRGGRAARS